MLILENIWESDYNVWYSDYVVVKYLLKTGHSGPFLIQLLKNWNEIEQTAVVVSVQKELNLLLAFLRILLKEQSEMSLKHWFLFLTTYANGLTEDPKLIQ